LISYYTLYNHLKASQAVIISKEKKRKEKKKKKRKGKSTLDIVVSTINVMVS